MSAEKEALNRLLVTQVSQSEKLPPITYNPGKEWFKVNGTILDAPNNDFRFKLSNQNSNTATYTFYFDTNKFAGYLQRRGGIADVVTWFGPFALSDELKLAIKEYRCRTNQDSNY